MKSCYSISKALLQIDLEWRSRPKICSVKLFAFVSSVWRSVCTRARHNYTYNIFLIVVQDVHLINKCTKLFVRELKVVTGNFLLYTKTLYNMQIKTLPIMTFDLRFKWINATQHLNESTRTFNFICICSMYLL